MINKNYFKMICVFTVIISNTYCSNYSKQQYDPSDYYNIEQKNNTYQVPKIAYKYAYTVDGKIVPIPVRIDNKYKNAKDGQVVPIKYPPTIEYRAKMVKDLTSKTNY